MVSKWRRGCGTVWDMVVEGARGWMEGVFGGMGGEKIFAMSKKKRYFANSLAHTIYIICNNKKSDRYGIGAVRREVELIKSE